MHPTPTLFDQPKLDVLSVSELAGALRRTVESRFREIWVEGEISNFKNHSSGHCYFTLKDEQAQIRAVMWRSSAGRLAFRPRDGMLVRVLADASVYETRGDLQLVVRLMKLAGAGALQQAFEELKQKLKSEGLFDARHKKPIPTFPTVIGVITSDSGAALHDVLSVLGRRFPCVSVVVCPVQVQGPGAAQSIASAIQTFNRKAPGTSIRPDVLIVGRGGGSLEDLWAFNEEVVARAIFDSTIPVISAVGHETDVSIADFVADVRAATPSMAAELAVPDCMELIATIGSHRTALTSALRRRIDRDRRHVTYLVSSHNFRRPIDRLRQHTLRLDDLLERLQRSGTRTMEEKRRRWQALSDRLSILSPERPLDRGFALVERDGHVVSGSAGLTRGDHVQLRFRDGRRDATITS